MGISESARTELSSLLHTLSDALGTSAGNDDLEREAERHLQAVRDSFKRLAKFGNRDVFVCHLMEQLETLAAVFVQAANKSKIPVTEHQFESAQLLAHAFGTSNRVFRYTWKTEAGERLFDDPVWRRHFELTSTMAMAGNLDVRALIVGEARLFEASNVQKLLEFFASHQKLTAKIALSADWDACMVDHAIPSNCLEFGIYGENLLYQADTYKPVSVGSWSKDPIDIKRFTQFFDAAWMTPAVAANNPAAASHKVSLSQLMDADLAYDRRNAGHQTVALKSEAA